MGKAKEPLGTGRLGHQQGYNDGCPRAACLPLIRPITIQPDNAQRLRYGLCVHAGLPRAEQIQSRWREFATRELPAMTARIAAETTSVSPDGFRSRHFREEPT